MNFQCTASFYDASRRGAKHTNTLIQDTASPHKVARAPSAKDTSPNAGRMSAWPVVARSRSADSTVNDDAPHPSHTSTGPRPHVHHVAGTSPGGGRASTEGLGICRAEQAPSKVNQVQHSRTLTAQKLRRNTAQLPRESTAALSPTSTACHTRYQGRERLGSGWLGARHHGRVGWDGRTVSHSCCGSLAGHPLAAMKRASYPVNSARGAKSGSVRLQAMPRADVGQRGSGAQRGRIAGQRGVLHGPPAKDRTARRLSAGTPSRAS